MRPAPKSGALFSDGGPHGYEKRRCSGHAGEYPTVGHSHPWRRRQSKEDAPHGKMPSGRRASRSIPREILRGKRRRFFYYHRTEQSASQKAPSSLGSTLSRTRNGRQAHSEKVGTLPEDVGNNRLRRPLPPEIPSELFSPECTGPASGHVFEIKQVILKFLDLGLVRSGIVGVDLAQPVSPGLTENLSS